MASNDDDHDPPTTVGAGGEPTSEVPSPRAERPPSWRGRPRSPRRSRCRVCRLRRPGGRPHADRRGDRRLQGPWYAG